MDGELPQERKARLTIWNPHPLQHTDDYISIVKGSEDLLFIPDAHSHRDVFCISFSQTFHCHTICLHPEIITKEAKHNGS